VKLHETRMRSLNSVNTNQRYYQISFCMCCALNHYDVIKAKYISESKFLLNVLKVVFRPLYNLYLLELSQIV